MVVRFGSSSVIRCRATWLIPEQADFSSAHVIHSPRSTTRRAYSVLRTPIPEWACTRATCGRAIPEWCEADLSSSNDRRSARTAHRSEYAARTRRYVEFVIGSPSRARYSAVRATDRRTMPAVVARARATMPAAVRPPILRRIAGWVRLPGRAARSGDPAVNLAAFLDDGERRDRQLVEL